MELSDLKQKCAHLSPWAHLATVRPDGSPDVTPVHTDLATKERLWTGVFDYDLNLFAPAGPSTPEVGFMAVTPLRALWLANYGMVGTERWSA
jgi:hypothetical protein